jgi:tetrapyrrole methylase family protein/MazG family protein
MITIVGCGPGPTGALTEEAKSALKSAGLVLARTRSSNVGAILDSLGVEFSSFDDVYDESPSFEDAYRTMAGKVLDEARTRSVAYAVPGHPLVAEETVRLILAEAKKANTPVRVIPGLSFLESVLAALNEPLDRGLVLVDAFSIQELDVNPQLPHLVYQTPDTDIASRVKLWLMSRLPDDHPVFIIRLSADGSGTDVIELPLYKLDRAEFNDAASVYVPAADGMERKSLQDLARLARRLRGEGGCPWDQEQTYESVRAYILEEAHEVVEAINSGDAEQLEEELGDLLFQVVFVAQLAVEEGVFDLADVCSRIYAKLVRRHPHVFGNITVRDTGEVLANWEKIKQGEKGRRHASILERVSLQGSALMAGEKIGEIASREGFDWQDAWGVLDKIEEEITELRQALEADDKKAVEEELGDLLLAVCSLGRKAAISPEISLWGAVRKFGVRYDELQRLVSAQGLRIGEMSEEALEALWRSTSTQD